MADDKPASGGYLNSWTQEMLTSLAGEIAVLKAKLASRDRVTDTRFNLLTIQRLKADERHDALATDVRDDVMPRLHALETWREQAQKRVQKRVQEQATAVAFPQMPSRPEDGIMSWSAACASAAQASNVPPVVAAVNGAAFNRLRDAVATVEREFPGYAAIGGGYPEIRELRDAFDALPVVDYDDAQASQDGGQPS